MAKLTRGAWRAALEGTDLEPTTPRPTVNRGAPRKHSRIYRPATRRAAVEGTPLEEPQPITK
jgi:hypothetical protein